MSGSPEKRKNNARVERLHEEEPTFIDKYIRGRAAWLDHLLRMQGRYTEVGGNQFSAGITYFSVLSIFPILMLLFALVGFVLASRPESVEDIREIILSSFTGDIGEQVNSILDTAINQRGTVAGFGAVTALWWGLGWMNNLRYGVTKMWRMDPTEGNFFLNKIRDFIILILLVLILSLGVGVTAFGSISRIHDFLYFIGISGFMHMGIIIKSISILLSILTSWIMFSWLIRFLPRGFDGKIPRKSILQASALAAVAFEIFKQFGSLFFTQAVKNPAGATFGPIIGVMVLLYFVWRILLYASAWAATTEESLINVAVPVPNPALIYMRNSPEHNMDRYKKKIIYNRTAYSIFGLLVGLFIGMIRHLFKK